MGLPEKDIQDLHNTLVIRGIEYAPLRAAANKTELNTIDRTKRRAQKLNVIHNHEEMDINSDCDTVFWTKARNPRRCFTASFFEGGDM